MSTQGTNRPVKATHPQIHSTDIPPANSVTYPSSAPTTVQNLTSELPARQFSTDNNTSEELPKRRFSTDK